MIVSSKPFNKASWALRAELHLQTEGSLSQKEGHGDDLCHSSCGKELIGALQKLEALLALQHVTADQLAIAAQKLCG